MIKSNVVNFPTIKYQGDSYWLERWPRLADGSSIENERLWLTVLDDHKVINEGCVLFVIYFCMKARNSMFDCMRY